VFSAMAHAQKCALNILRTQNRHCAPTHMMETQLHKQQLLCTLDK